MMRSIIQAPDDRLRKVAAPLPPLTIETADLWRSVADDLRDTFAMTMNCLGLAAVQIDLPWRAIIVDTSSGRRDTFLMINPVITKTSRELQSVRDGCMSVERGTKFAQTFRPKRLIVEWFTRDGRPRRQGFNGLLAAAIHHEVDHLDGILYLDRVNSHSTNATNSTGQSP